MPRQRDINAETTFITETLVNQLGAAEGTGLPPRQRGLTRVPIVSSLRVLKVEPFVGGTQVTLVWDNPEPPLHRFIDHYNVYVTGLFEGGDTPQGPSSFTTSPATLKLESSGGLPVTAYVQTQMKSGVVSDLFQSPSVSFTTEVSDVALGAGALTTPNRIVLVGTTAGSLTQLGSLGTTTTVLHGNAAGAPAFSAVSLTADVTGTLPVTRGGTGLTGGTSGGVLGFTAATTLASSAALTANALVLGGGAGATPSTPVGLGTTTTVLHGNAAGAPSFGAVSLTADVTGTLPLGNGGTGATAFTAGSVPFSNGTILTEDNANLFWDDTSNFLGVGTATPGARLHVQETTLGAEVQRLSSTATGDDPTEKVYQNRVATTDATVTTLHTVAVPATTTLALEAVVVARRTGGTAGTAEDGARYKLSAVYKNVAGTATLIGAVSKNADEDQAGWDANFTLSAGDVLVEVTGALDNNVTWHLTLRTYGVSS